MPGGYIVPDMRPALTQPCPFLPVSSKGLQGGIGMNRTFKAAVAALMLAASSAGLVAAGPFEAAVAAYEKGLAAHEKAYATALRLLRPLAEQGNAVAQYNLGVMYAQGQGVSQDYAAAASWYLKAAEQGNAVAQYNIGVMYEDGQGVPQDYAVAVS
jgi:TPR repeat protein